MGRAQLRERYMRALAEWRGYPFVERADRWAARLAMNDPDLQPLAVAGTPQAPPYRAVAPAASMRAGITCRSAGEPWPAGRARFERMRERSQQSDELHAFIEFCPLPVTVPHGSLNGMVIGVKDLIAVQGVTTTGGSRAIDAIPAGADAVCVARLRQAGALMLGTLNLHELAYGITSVNPHFGAVVNPRAPVHMAGGSSGGSAAAVAAGLVDAALGTDTAGSIRIPAACCGIVGFKPSFGAIATDGVMALGWSLDHVGPMTSCVADAAAMYDAMVEPDSPLREPGAAADGGWTLVKPADHFFERLAEPVRRRMEQALTLLETQGMRIVERPVERLELAAGIQFTTLCVEATEQHLRLLETRPDGLGEDVRLRLEVGQFIPAVDYQRAQRLRTELDRAMLSALAGAHAYVTPTLPVTVPPAGADEVVLGDRSVPVHTALTRCTAPFNLTGMPAITLPCGVDDDGVPIGLQLAARRGDDAMLLRLAQEVEPLLSRLDAGGAI